MSSDYVSTNISIFQKKKMYNEESVASEKKLFIYIYIYILKFSNGKWWWWRGEIKKQRTNIQCADK